MKQPPPPAGVVAITRYQARDGTLWDLIGHAAARNRELDRCAHANWLLELGFSVYDAAETSGLQRLSPYTRRWLHMITRANKLAIPHWQCCDEPVYRVGSFEAGRGLYVGGAPRNRAGYGDYVKLSELVRYVAHTERVWGL